MVSAQQEFEKLIHEKSSKLKEDTKEFKKWLDWALTDPDVKKIEVKNNNNKEYYTIYERK